LTPILANKGYGDVTHNTRRFLLQRRFFFFRVGHLSGKFRIVVNGQYTPRNQRR